MVWVFLCFCCGSVLVLVCLCFCSVSALVYVFIVSVLIMFRSGSVSSCTDSVSVSIVSCFWFDCVLVSVFDQFCSGSVLVHCFSCYGGGLAHLVIGNEVVANFLDAPVLDLCLWLTFCASWIKWCVTVATAAAAVVMVVAIGVRRERPDADLSEISGIII